MLTEACVVSDCAVLDAVDVEVEDEGGAAESLVLIGREMFALMK